MSRYIDADALLRKLPDDLPYKASVKRVLIQAPEADVVPKSEYDVVVSAVDNSTKEVLKLSEYYQDAKSEIDRICYNLKAVLEERAETRAEISMEISMEIFEEIERFLYLNFRFCKEEIGGDDTEYVKGRLELNTQIQNFIAELKKKYIHRECPKCKYFVGCEKANWVRGCDEYREGEV